MQDHGRRRITDSVEHLQHFDANPFAVRRKSQSRYFLHFEVIVLFRLVCSPLGLPLADHTQVLEPHFRLPGDALFAGHQVLVPHVIAIVT